MTPVRLDDDARSNGDGRLNDDGRCSTGVAHDDGTDPIDRFTGIREHAQRPIGVLRGNDHDHSDPAIEYPQHLGIGDIARVPQPIKDCRLRPTGALQPRLHAIG